jgi:hypothetical protein
MGELKIGFLINGIQIRMGVKSESLVAKKASKISRL